MATHCCYLALLCCLEITEWKNLDNRIIRNSIQNSLISLPYQSAKFRLVDARYPFSSRRCQINVVTVVRVFTDWFPTAAGALQQRVVYTGRLGSAWIWKKYSTYKRLAGTVLPTRCRRRHFTDGGLPVNISSRTYHHHHHHLRTTRSA